MPVRPSRPSVSMGPVDVLSATHAAPQIVGEHPLALALTACVRSLAGTATPNNKLLAAFDHAEVWLALCHQDLSDWCRVAVRREFRSAARLVRTLDDLDHERLLLANLAQRSHDATATAANAAVSMIDLELAALREGASLLASKPGFLAAFIRHDWSPGPSWFREQADLAVRHAARVAVIAASGLPHAEDGLVDFDAALRAGRAAATLLPDALPSWGDTLCRAVGSAAVITRLQTTLARLSTRRDALSHLAERFEGVWKLRRERALRAWHECDPAMRASCGGDPR